ncbi:MAG: hypothetical protein A2776_00540 [Candidatus Levybacteria bacterium RIFCSPHIGHO2_01_FULL_40_10]|nr:MAG: hypothetical protein A2776_00540 [Candidatus Levybacteria bacterium RIFCSPHIGHO2_01_FULL_40_10]
MEMRGSIQSKLPLVYLLGFATVEKVYLKRIHLQVFSHTVAGAVARGTFETKVPGRIVISNAPGGLNVG